MGILLDVILPVFLVIGFGWAATRARLFSDAGNDGLMRFAQSFAIPVLLFRSVSELDLAATFDPGLIGSFYIGAFAGFAVGFLAALRLFNRPLDECVTVGFACMFSNSLLLGLSITERAYGKQALAGNYAIIAMHSPMFYAFGIALMEWVRHRGNGLSGPALATKVTRAIFAQPLVIGITAGIAVNLAGLSLPQVLADGCDLISRAGLPAALFGLGGILTRYRPEGDKALIAVICVVTLVLHPAITFALARWFGLSLDYLRSAVVTAAMPPGVNAYLFAHLYSTGRSVNASSVLIATALSILTAWFWLQLLP
jgi:malonate transporter and related proteins